MSKVDNSRLAVVVLAAGMGKRMKSGLPKVLHQICGCTLLEYVLEAVDPLGAGSVTVVVGTGSDDVVGTIGDGFRIVHQAEQKGTGHAVMVALEGLDPSFDEVMVLPGDAPLITTATLERLVAERREHNAAASLLTAVLDDPSGYGRVVRFENWHVEAIIEEVDATEEQRGITEVAACTYSFDRAALEAGLSTLTTDNAQGEYYLTDVIGGFTAGGQHVVPFCGEPEEVMGVNDREQLAEVCRIMRARVNSRLMAAGVAMIDPATTYVDHDVEIGAETLLMPMTFIGGKSAIGKRCRIGPCTSIHDTTVADGCEVQFSVVDGCEISEDANIGPFSRLRPGCRLGPGSKAGTFVEMKKTTVGRGSKVPHLSYMGDTTIGEDANVGAGSITCNYDGENKFPTTIGDRAFIGSDTMMVAPLNIGNDAVTGAGSVISEDVPDGSLAIERTEQRIVPGYRDRKKGNKRKDK